MKEVILRISDVTYEFAKWAAKVDGYNRPEEYLAAMLNGAVFDDRCAQVDGHEKPFIEDEGGVWPPAGDLDDGIPF